MKSKLRSLIFFFFFSIGALLAQDPGSTSTANTPIGKGAPIGGGLIILASLGIGYAVSKIYRMRRDYKDILE